MLEAQASGLPVVAYDAQAMSERLTSGEEGILIPTTGDLTDALLPLCLERDLRERYGRAARLRAEQQTWEAIFDELEERYLRMTAPRETRMGRPVLQALGV